MGRKLEINNEKQIIQLYNNKRQEWEDKSMSISAIFIATYYGNETGFDIYFKGGDKKFFYKDENVRILHMVKNISIEKQDVYANNVKVDAIRLELFEKGFYRIFTNRSTILTQKIELKSNKYRDIFTYFTKLAEFAGTIEIGRASCRERV